MKKHVCPAAVVAVAQFLSACASTPEVIPGEGQPMSFERDIKPVLEQRCVTCHNSDTLPGRLNFENAAGAFVKDELGRPYIVPGKPQESRLYTAVMAPEFQDLAMPPVSHRVSRENTARIYQWIIEGAEWPKGPAGTIVPPYKVLE